MNISNNDIMGSIWSGVGTLVFGAIVTFAFQMVMFEIGPVLYFTIAFYIGATLGVVWFLLYFCGEIGYKIVRFVWRTFMLLFKITCVIAAVGGLIAGLAMLGNIN